MNESLWGVPETLHMCGCRMTWLSLWLACSKPLLYLAERVAQASVTPFHSVGSQTVGFKQL